MEQSLLMLALPLVWNSRREPVRQEDILPRMLERAVDAYAPQARQERALLLWDSTLTGRGSAGFLITDRALYLRYIDPVRLAFDRVVAVRQSQQLPGGADILTQAGVEKTLYLGPFLHLPLVYGPLQRWVTSPACWRA